MRKYLIKLLFSGQMSRFSVSFLFIFLQFSPTGETQVSLWCSNSPALCIVCQLYCAVYVNSPQWNLCDLFWQHYRRRTCVHCLATILHSIEPVCLLLATLEQYAMIILCMGIFSQTILYTYLQESWYCDSSLWLWLLLTFTTSTKFPASTCMASAHVVSKLHMWALGIAHLKTT